MHGQYLHTQSTWLKEECKSTSLKSCFSNLDGRKINIKPYAKDVSVKPVF